MDAVSEIAVDSRTAIPTDSENIVEVVHLLPDMAQRMPKSTDLRGFDRIHFDDRNAAISGMNNDDDRTKLCYLQRYIKFIYLRRNVVHTQNITMVTAIIVSRYVESNYTTGSVYQ